MERMAVHLKERHAIEAVEFGKTIKVAAQLFASYLLIKQYVDIPDEETEFNNWFEEAEEQIASIFGFEPEKAEEEVKP
jgi:hypothetical protein